MLSPAGEAGGSTTRGRIKRAVIALTAAHSWLAWQMSSWGAESNRYFGHWSTADAVALVSLVLLLAGAAFCLREVLRSLGWARGVRALDCGFLAVVAMGAASFTRHLPGSEWYGWALLGLVPLAWLAPQLRIIERAATLCLILSPVVPITWFQLFGYDTSWGAAQQHETVHVPASNGASPIFFFVFDAWSYAHLTGSTPDAPSDEISSRFANLRQLAARSDFFTNARSLVPTTPVALPSILYQRELAFGPVDGTAYLQTANGALPSQSVPSVFQIAKQRGYTTALTGFHLPYDAILGEQVDDYWIGTDQPHGTDPIGKVKLRFASNHLYLNDPLSRAVLGDWYRELDSRHWAEMNRSMRTRALAQIAQAPPNSFLFHHWPLPHPPFVFDATGDYAGRYAGSRMDGSTAEYEEQLQYLDLVVGELVAALEQNGRFDPALLILTSDHAWVQDPNPPSRDLTHVPLIIKRPGQKVGRRIEDPIANYGLMHVLHSAFSTAP